MCCFFIWTNKFLTVISTAVALLILQDNILHPSCVLSSDHNQLNSLGGQILAACSRTIPAGYHSFICGPRKTNIGPKSWKKPSWVFFTKVRLYLLLLIDVLNFQVISLLKEIGKVAFFLLTAQDNICV